MNGFRIREKVRRYKFCLEPGCRELVNNSKYCPKHNALRHGQSAGNRQMACNRAGRLSTDLRLHDRLTGIST